MRRLTEKTAKDLAAHLNRKYDHWVFSVERRSLFRDDKLWVVVATHLRDRKTIDMYTRDRAPVWLEACRVTESESESEEAPSVSP